MKNIKDPIQAQVDILKDIVAASGFTAQQIAEHEEKCMELLDDLEAFMKYLTDNRELADAANDASLLEKLEQTLKQDLVKVDTKYLVCEQKSLISPAGFHASDRVFLQPTIAIHVDDLSKFKVPAGQQLYAHDIDKIAERD